MKICTVPDPPTGSEPGAGTRGLHTGSQLPRSLCSILEQRRSQPPHLSVLPPAGSSSARWGPWDPFPVPPAHSCLRGAGDEGWGQDSPSPSRDCSSSATPWALPYVPCLDPALLLLFWKIMGRKNNRKRKTVTRGHCPISLWPGWLCCVSSHLLVYPQPPGWSGSTRG